MENEQFLLSLCCEEARETQLFTMFTQRTGQRIVLKWPALGNQVQGAVADFYAMIHLIKTQTLGLTNRFQESGWQMRSFGPPKKRHLKHSIAITGPGWHQRESQLIIIGIKELNRRLKIRMSSE